MTTDKVRRTPKNPNKRDCVAVNITFPVVADNERLLRELGVHVNTREGVRDGNKKG